MSRLFRDEPYPLTKYKTGDVHGIRKKHADILFTGRFMDAIGATVQCGENSRFSVFEPMNDKTRKAVVVVNFGNEEDDAEVNIKGDRGDRQNSIFHSKRIRPFCYLQK